MSEDNLNSHDIGYGKVFVVKPNGTDDNGPLQKAFDDAIKAGTGSVIKLVKGNITLALLRSMNSTAHLLVQEKGKQLLLQIQDLPLVIYRAVAKCPP